MSCIITFGDGLRLHHASLMHDMIRSVEIFYNLLRRLLRRTFAAQIYDNAWFPSSLKKSLLKVSLQKANKRGYHFCFIPGSHPKPQQVSILSILLRYNRRNLSQPKPSDLGALLKSHLPSAFLPSLTARTSPQIRTVSASLSVGRSLKTSCKCTLFLTAFL